MKKRRFAKRFFALLCAFLIVGAVCLLPLMALDASAAGEMTWRLVDTEILDYEDSHGAYGAREYGKWQREVRINADHIEKYVTSIGYSEYYHTFYYSNPEVKDEETITASYSELPKAIKAGEEIVIDVHVNASYRFHSENPNNLGNLVLGTGVYAYFNLDTQDSAGLGDFNSFKSSQYPENLYQEYKDNHGGTGFGVYAPFNGEATNFYVHENNYSDAQTGTLSYTVPPDYSDEYIFIYVLDVVKALHKYTYALDPSTVGGTTVNSDASTAVGEIIGDVFSGEEVLGVFDGLLVALAALGAAGAAGLVSAAVPALAGAGAAGAAASRPNDDGGKDKQEQSTFKMYLWKDFGDSIKYGGEAQAVYARMEEIRPDGQVVKRDDLTAMINISTACPNLALSAPGIVNGYQCANVKAWSRGANDPSEGVISFRFGGGEAFFQNNVKFRLVGDASIEFMGRGAASSAAVSTLAASGGAAALPFRAVDFIRPPTDFGFEFVTQNDAFVPEVRAGADGGRYIQLLDCFAEDKIPDPLTATHRTYTAKLWASNGNERAEGEFYVRVCFEGMVVDFGQGDKPDRTPMRRILSSMDENMPGTVKATFADIYISVWNREKGEIEKIAPEAVSAKFDIVYRGVDIAERIQIKTGVSQNRGDVLSCKMEPSVCFPNNEDVPGKVTFTVRHKGAEYAGEYDIELEGDKMQFVNDLNEQVEKTKEIIHKYVREEAKPRYMKALAAVANNPRTRPEDIHLLRHDIWGKARDRLLSEANEIRLEAEIYESVAKGLADVEWVCDIAFNILATAMFGPTKAVSTYALGAVKDIFKNAIFAVWHHGASWEAVEVGIKGSVKSLLGDLDTLYDAPLDKGQTAIMRWFAIFMIYRTAYNYIYGNRHGKPLSISGAIEQAAWDLATHLLKAVAVKFLKDNSIVENAAERLSDAATEAVWETYGLETNLDKVCSFFAKWAKEIQPGLAKGTGG